MIAANTDGDITTYEYGLERIAAYGGDAKTTYDYDGRGSMVSVAGYTPFGEQMGDRKQSGFGYNIAGECYPVKLALAFFSR